MSHADNDQSVPCSPQFQGGAMTLLSPMRAEAFAPYFDAAIIGYAEDNVLSGRWPADGAVERSRADFQSSLPQGLQTPDNHLFEIKADEHSAGIGVVWFAVQVRDGLRSAFVYDLEVKAEFRRQGHALRALQALEPIVAALGLSTIALHVFGQNQGAQALYTKLGYGVTGINMLKRLDERLVDGSPLCARPATD
jgi:ribosomal protein S18 acetylase RimI-like enzyme